jgi:hypothetical protein
VERRVQRAGIEHAWHDEKGDGPGHRHAEEDSINVVVVVCCHDERSGRGKVFDTGDTEVEQLPQERLAREPQPSIEGRERLASIV